MTAVGSGVDAPRIRHERDLFTPEPAAPRKIHTELAPQASAQAVKRLANRPSANAMGTRLDDFLQKLEPEYRVNGKKVRVSAGFNSLYGTSDANRSKALYAVRREIGAAKFEAVALQIRRAQSSRGTPEDVRVATQALIDAGAVNEVLAVNPQLDEAQAIRFVMQQFRIGLDCRGYVYRAFLHARGTGSAPARAGAYFDTDVGNILFQSENRLRKVELGAARTGDIIRLEPDSSGRDHNVIVRSNEIVKAHSGPVTAGGKPVPREFIAAGWPKGSTPELRVVTVDSAWGGGGNSQLGGAKREVWLHNEKTGQWAYWDMNGDFRTSKGPYNHELDGVFRPRSES